VGTTPPAGRIFLPLLVQRDRLAIHPPSWFR
jgi:hypothetical protein